MKKNGKTKKDFAEAVGIAPESLKQYYSGRHVPGRDLVVRFARVLGCHIGDLLGEAPDSGEAVPRDEAFGNIMGILGKNLSPETRAAMIEMAKAAQVIGREREEAEKKGKGGRG
jgi:transcriptional regulator with XRE-family HTH domain